MNNILVINAGSSSLKYQLMNMEDQSVLAKGIAERIGIEGSIVKYKTSKDSIEIKQPMKDHVDAIKLVLDALINPQYGVLKSMDEIAAVGHRVVHGGEDFSSSVIIDEAVIKAIEANVPLAPLHNPANLMGIEACKKIMPNTPMVGVFDTAFHQTMPAKAFIYGLPYEDYKELKVRRYGFHGTSHSFVARRVAEVMGKKVEDLKIITCHLGNGSSIAAVKHGKCVDTSMGLTPLEGVIMGTRCGSIDPAIVKFLMEKKGFDIMQVDAYLNKNSGVWGISGVSSDFRDINDAMDAGNERAALALEAHSYSVKKYIGAYAAAMNGVDAIVFTAGVGENDRVVRKLVMEGMEYLGVQFDVELNETTPRGKEVELSKPGSKVKVFMLPTNEELVIATDTFELTNKK